VDVHVDVDVNSLYRIPFRIGLFERPTNIKPPALPVATYCEG
jgi:hypothetical protein